MPGYLNLFVLISSISVFIAANTTINTARETAAYAHDCKNHASPRIVSVRAIGRVVIVVMVATVVVVIVVRATKVIVVVVRAVIVNLVVVQAAIVIVVWVIMTVAIQVNFIRLDILFVILGLDNTTDKYCINQPQIHF